MATSFLGRFSFVWLGTSRCPGEEVKAQSMIFNLFMTFMHSRL